MSSEFRAIDRSTASFHAKKLGFLHIKGTLGEFSGTVSFDPKHPEAAVFDLCPAARTIDSGNAKRDEHLKSADFFDVDEHPEVCFVSRSVKRVNDRFRADGKLSLLSLSKEVSIPFSYHQDEFKGQFSLKRKDYGLGKKFPSFFVANTIDIAITCQTK